MLSVAWSVEGQDLDIDLFLAQFPLVTTMVWHKGKLDRRGMPYKTSGCSLTIDQQDTEDEAVIYADMQDFMQTHKPMLNWLQDQQIISAFDIGMTVGEEPYFTRTLHLQPSLLVLCVESHITIKVSAYP